MSIVIVDPEFAHEWEEIIDLFRPVYTDPPKDTKEALYRALEGWCNKKCKLCG